MAHVVSTPEVRARKRAEDYMALVSHIGAFVAVNTFLWILDIVQGGGVDYAYWTTIPWGLGLGFHIMAFSTGDNTESRRYQKYLVDERRRESEIR